MDIGCVLMNWKVKGRTIALCGLVFVFGGVRRGALFYVGFYLLTRLLLHLLLCCFLGKA